MKKLKKLTAFLLVVSMAFALCACGSKDSGKDTTKELDAKKIYKEAVEKNSALTSSDMTSVVKMSFSQGEESMDFTTSMDTKVSGMNTDSLTYYAKTTMDMSGESVEMTMYYTDGYCYLSQLGQNIKYAYDMDGIVSQIQQNVDTSTLSVDSMEKMTAKKEGDSYVIDFVADPESMNDYVKQALSSLEGVTDGVNMNIEKVDGSYTVNKDGYYTLAKVNMTLSMEAEGETVDMNLTVDSTVNNPGEEVSITLPDFSGYTEVDAVSLGIQ